MFCQTESTTFGMKIDFGITSVPLTGRNSAFPNQNATGTITGGFLNSSTSNSGFGQPPQSHTQFGGFGNTNTVPFVNQQSMNPFGTNALTQALGQNNNQTGFGINPNGQPSIQDLNNPFSRPNISAPISSNSSPGSTDISGTVVKFNPVVGTDTIQNRGLTQSIRVLYWCINFMKEYEDKSLEELRFEDYKQGRRGPQTGFSNTGGLFPSAVTQPAATFFNQPFTFSNSSSNSNQFANTPSTSWYPTKTNSIFTNPQGSCFDPTSASNPSTGFFNLKPNSYWSCPGGGFNQPATSVFSTKAANTPATQNFLYKSSGFSLTPSTTSANNPFSNLPKSTFTFAPSANYRPLNYPNSNCPPISQLFKTTSQFPFTSSTIKQNSSTTIHDQILGLITTPFGRCSLLKNVPTSSTKTEHARTLKTAFTVNKPRNRTLYKIATNSSSKIKPKVIGVGLHQKALFDSLEQEDSNLLETFQVHPSAKRLVFRSKPASDTFQTLGTDNSNANISTTSSSGESSTTDKENFEL